MSYIRIIKHMTSAIQKAEVHSEPFWHFYVEGFLPPDVYKNLLANMPPTECYSPLDLRKYSRAAGNAVISTRDQLYVRQALAGGTMPVRCVDVIGPIYAALESGDLRNATFKQLRRGIEERLRSNSIIPLPIIEHDIRFMRDIEDYEIKPHRDGLSKLVTMQIYLPPDDSTPDLGTSLFEAREPHHPRQSMAEVPDSNFVEVKRFPFLPNSAYAFVVSNGPDHVSWHGRQKLTGFKGVRNTLMVLFQQV